MCGRCEWEEGGGCLPEPRSPARLPAPVPLPHSRVVCVLAWSPLALDGVAEGCDWKQEGGERDREGKVGVQREARQCARKVMCYFKLRPKLEQRRVERAREKSRALSNSIREAGETMCETEFKLRPNCRNAARFGSRHMGWEFEILVSPQWRDTIFKLPAHIP